ncbi:MFS transporter [Rhodococcus sp. D2-41]|nr:MFS transporter [Rhodococcus sp. D2-41]
MAVVVWFASPADPRPAPTHSYPASLRSVLTLIRTRDVLRHRMFLGVVNMAGFSLLWTSIAFLLAGAHGSPYHFSDAVIGLFGLAGIAGAMGAPVVGRFADRGHVRRPTYLMWVIQLAGWALLLADGASLPVLIAALLVFDLGVQGLQLCNQVAIYALDAEARSRITTAYMVAYFAGGIVGSLVAGVAYQAGGWPLVCGLGAASAALGLAARSVFAGSRSGRAAA